MLAHSAKSPRTVHALLICVMLIWGVNISVVKQLTGSMSELQICMMRMMVASITLTLFVLGRDRRLPRLSRRQWGILAAAAALMIYSNQLLFVKGTHLSSAGTTSLVMAMTPALAAGFGILFFKERPTLTNVLGLAFGFGGVAVVVATQAPGTSLAPGWGELIVLSGLVVFIMGGLLLQGRARGIDALTIGWAIHCLGAVMLATHIGLTAPEEFAGLADVQPAHWGMLVFSGSLGSGVTNVAWFFALGAIGVARASVFFYWLPIFGTLVAALWLRESVGPWHLLGLALVVLGTFLACRPRAGVAAKAGPNEGETGNKAEAGEGAEPAEVDEVSQGAVKTPVIPQ